MLVSNSRKLYGLIREGIPINGFKNRVRFPTSALHDILIRYSEGVEYRGGVMSQVVKTTLEAEPIPETLEIMVRSRRALLINEFVGVSCSYHLHN